MKPFVLIIPILICLFASEQLLQAQSEFHVSFHVKSVRAEDVSKGWCDAKCTATKYTVEGQTNSVEYVAECIEVLAYEPKPHFNVVCDRLHAHSDYQAKIDADYLIFAGSEQTSENAPAHGAYRIISEREIPKPKK